MGGLTEITPWVGIGYPRVNPLATRPRLANPGNGRSRGQPGPVPHAWTYDRWWTAAAYVAPRSQIGLNAATNRKPDVDGGALFFLRFFMENNNRRASRNNEKIRKPPA